MAIIDFERQFYTQGQMLIQPTIATHFATKGYVDDLIAGMRWDPVEVVSVDNLNGVLSGDFLTLTAAASEIFPDVDDITLSVGDRILVNGQTDAKANGLYEVTDVGSASTPWVLTRTSDADVDAEFVAGKMVYVKQGTDFGDTNFRLVNNAVTLGTTDITFEAWTTAGLEEVQAEITGDGSLTEFSVSHTLNTRLVTVDAFEATTMRPVTFAYEADTVNTIKVMSGIAVPNGNAYILLIRGRTQ